jgi:hypothetical protein
MANALKIAHQVKLFLSPTMSLIRSMSSCYKLEWQIIPFQEDQGMKGGKRYLSMLKRTGWLFHISLAM